MKFLVTKELEQSALLRYLIAAVVFFLLLYVGFDVVLHGYVIGLDMQSATLTLFGDMDNFIEPVLLDALLLQVHIDLFMGLFVLLILTSVFIRLYGEIPATKWVVHLLFVLGMLAPLALMLAYTLGEATGSVLVFAWSVIFLCWHLVAVVVGLLVLKKLFVK